MSRSSHSLDVKGIDLSSNVFGLILPELAVAIPKLTFAQSMSLGRVWQNVLIFNYNH